MRRIKIENTGPLLRIGSKKNFRISSPKIETLRKRRKLNLEVGETIGTIVEYVSDNSSGPQPSPPSPLPLPLPETFLSSRTSVNIEQ